MLLHIQLTSFQNSLSKKGRLSSMYHVARFWLSDSILGLYLKAESFRIIHTEVLAHGKFYLYIQYSTAVFNKPSVLHLTI